MVAFLIGLVLMGSFAGWHAMHHDQQHLMKENQHLEKQVNTLEQHKHDVKKITQLNGVEIENLAGKHNDKA